VSDADAPLEFPREFTVDSDWQTARRTEPRFQRPTARVGNRWLRSIAVVLAVLVGLKLMVSAATVVPQEFSLEAQMLPPVPAPPSPDLRPIALPSVPEPAPERAPAPAAAPARDGSATQAAGDYLIAVGTFRSVEGANRMVDELGQVGHQVFRRAARAGESVLQQVLVGPFASRDAADHALGRIRELGGYDDARVVSQRPTQE
jgi:cell division septation protein DedD